MLICREPNASTTSGSTSSVFTVTAFGSRFEGNSRCKGALIFNSSSVNNGCCSADRREWEERSASSNSRMRIANSAIFSCSSCVEARTKLKKKSLQLKIPLHLMAKIRTDFPGRLSATPTSHDEECSQMHAWNHTSGQIAPHPRFTHELHGIARSHLNLSLRRVIIK